MVDLRQICSKRRHLSGKMRRAHNYSAAGSALVECYSLPCSSTVRVASFFVEVSLLEGDGVAHAY